MLSYWSIVVVVVDSSLDFACSLTRSLLRAKVSVVLALLEYELSEALAVELEALELEHDRLAHDGLFFGVAHASEQRVFQALLQRDAIIRVKHQNLLQEVDCLRWRAGVLDAEVGAWIALELFKVLKRFEVSNEALI